MRASWKIARRNPAQIEHRQECVEALRSPRPFREDRRREANTFASLRRATITRLRLLHFDRADPSLERANRIMSVPNDALAAVRKDEIGVHGEERVELNLHGLHDELARTRAQDFGERIVDSVFLSE